MVHKKLRYVTTLQPGGTSDGLMNNIVVLPLVRPDGLKTYRVLQIIIRFDPDIFVSSSQECAYCLMTASDGLNSLQTTAELGWVKFAMCDSCGL